MKQMPLVYVQHRSQSVSHVCMMLEIIGKSEALTQ